MIPAPAVPQDRITTNHVAGSGSAGSAALWAICLAVAERRRSGQPLCGFTVDSAGVVTVAGGSGDRNPARPENAVAGLDGNPVTGTELWGAWDAQAQAMFSLYQPLLGLCRGQRYVIGHLGQSLDGRIATRSGDACFINGQQNLTHMHRLRALCDAVLVGAGTVVADDPQLTTRLVAGPHATRVVLDPSGRITSARRLCSDGKSPTLLIRYADLAPEACGAAETIAVGRTAEGIDLASLLETLAGRGLHAILVEGGGVTVSRFLEERLLHRLQVTIAPVIIGSGRQGLQLPEVVALSDSLRPPCRHHSMGEDILWDLDLQHHHR